jgi:hypothetical protein
VCVCVCVCVYVCMCIVVAVTTIDVRRYFDLTQTTLIRSLSEYAAAMQETEREGSGAEVFQPRSEPLGAGGEADGGAPGWALDTLYKEYVAAKGGSIPALQKMMGVQTP